MSYGNKFKALFALAFTAVSYLPGAAGNPYLIADDRIRSLDITPVLGRGYSIMTNSFQSTCLEVEEITIPSFNYDYSFYSFQQQSDLEEDLSGDLSKTFVYGRLKAAVAVEYTYGRVETSEKYFISTIMRIERYYASLREEKSKLSEDAAFLLDRQDYIGFFKSCGPNYIRGIRRAQEVSAIFSFTSNSAETASEFTKSFKASNSRKGKSVAVQAASSSSQKFSSIETSLEIQIIGFGLGLNTEGTETLVASSLEEFNGIMRFAYNTMTKHPDAAHVGMVYGIEIVPWVENVQFQALSKILDEVIEIPVPRSLIPRSFIREMNGTRTTRFDETRREEFGCKDDVLQIDKYGYCCERDALYDFTAGTYDSLDPELRLCRPLRQVDPSIIRENMATNGEFIARLDRTLRFKVNQLSTLEKCISTARSIPERFNHYYLQENSNAQYDKELSFVFTVLDLKIAVDPFGDYGMVRQMSKELDEFVDMYYQPCLAAIFGANIGASANTDASYFMAYPWHTHDECLHLSCLGSNMRWDRENGGCKPGLITRPADAQFEQEDEYCSYSVDDGYDAEPQCKYLTADLSLTQSRFTSCWDGALPSGGVDYFMEHFCMPTISSTKIEDAAEIQQKEDNFSNSCVSV